MAAKKSSGPKSRTKSKGKPSPASKPSRGRKAAKPTYVTSRTPKTLPKALRPLKPSAKTRAPQKGPKPSKGPAPKNYLKTKTYKQFARQYKSRADKDYWKQIQKDFKTLYDKKGQPLRVVMININKKYVHNTKNRLQETRLKYTGKEKWRKGKDGKWKEGRLTTRNKYRDKLLGQYVKGKAVGKRFLKVMEKDLVRKFMKKHRIKNYNKAKAKFWKEAESKSIYKLVQLYGGSP